MRILLVTGVLVAVALAGCSTQATGVPDPYADYNKPSGQTVHLRMSVVDLVDEVYPGMKANLWAFCAEAADEGDAYSAAAVEYWTHLPTDGTVSGYADGHCSVPGPTIRVHQGDRVVVDFCHSHFHGHTIHWHGQFVPNDADGAPGVTQGIVNRGDCYTYDFHAYKAGTLWYHCHVDTQLHVMQGLYGLFIVVPDKAHDAPDAKDIPKADEHYLVMGTLRRSIVENLPGVSPHRHRPGCLVSGTPGCQDPPVDVTPDTYLLNGHSFPETEKQTDTDTTRGTLIQVHEGQTIRLRVLNAGNTFETLHLHGHDMEVVARDGTPLASPYWVDTLTVGPAERYDLVVKANNPGAWMIHTHVATHETNDAQSLGGMHTMMVYDGFMSKMDQFAAQSELPGGMTPMPPTAIPADVFNQTIVGPLSSACLTPVGGPCVGDGSVAPHVDQTAAASFDVMLPCAVRGLHLWVHAQAGSTAQQASQGDLLAQVHSPSGDLVAEFHVPAGQTDAAWQMDANGTGYFGGRIALGANAGRFTVDVTGGMADTTVTVSSLVDYYESWYEAKYASETNTYGDCLVVPEI